MSPGAEKARLAAGVESRVEELVDLCRSLVRVDSTNPPDDTTAIVESIEAVLDATAGIEHRRVVGRAPAVNLVARTRASRPGRLVLNGHLDTFPIGEARWSHPPLGADLEDGRIYGRGACDMKAGVAAWCSRSSPWRSSATPGAARSCSPSSATRRPAGVSAVPKVHENGRSGSAGDLLASSSISL